MEIKKMSLVNIQGKLSRAEMRAIMAGSYGGGKCEWSINCKKHDDCSGGGSRCKCQATMGSSHCSVSTGY